MNNRRENFYTLGHDTGHKQNTENFLTNAKWMTMVLY